MRTQIFVLLALLTGLSLLACDLHSAVRQTGRGRGGQSSAPKELKSINLSHPLILSFASGTLRNNFVSEFEIGLAGAKMGLGFGTFDNQSLMSIKAVAMYTWKSPFNEEWDAPFIDQEPFPIDRWYYGGEIILSNGDYRLGLAAYRLYEPELGDIEETLYGASLGLGF